MAASEIHTIRALIVDDEPLSRAIIREFLSAHADIIPVAECGNGYEAIKAIIEEKPDLIFLDIQMPKLSGFDVLELISEPVHVIFITAFDQFAIRAFEVHAVDYLLKPVSRERFDEALNHVRKLFAAKQPTDTRKIAGSFQSSGPPLERIIVRDGTNVLIIPAEMVDYIEAQDDYVMIRWAGQSALKQQRLSELERLLDSRLFIRLHRSYIVQISRISKIELYAKDSRVVILKDGTKIPVSRNGYEKLKRLLFNV